MADKPRNLDPAIVAFAQELLRGALVILNGAPGKGTQSVDVLRFQYNPEAITRNRTGEWEAGKLDQSKGKPPASPRPAGGRTDGAHKGAGLFAKSETIAIKLVFDATEAILKEGDPDAGGAPSTDAKPSEVGVLPELAVLELAALGGEPKDDKDKKANAKGVPNTDAHPKEMLLVLGKRSFPVVITSMTINEKRFSPKLVPIRAEVDLQLRVIEAREVKGNELVQYAFDALVEQREAAAKQAVFQREAQTGDAKQVSEFQAALLDALTPTRGAARDPWTESEPR